MSRLASAAAEGCGFRCCFVLRSPTNLLFRNGRNADRCREVPLHNPSALHPSDYNAIRPRPRCEALRPDRIGKSDRWEVRPTEEFRGSRSAGLSSTPPMLPPIEGLTDRDYHCPKSPRQPPRNPSFYRRASSKCITACYAPNGTTEIDAPGGALPFRARGRQLS
jgi:hypothetical protein